jgi:molybdopterin molybdotransferase
LHSSAGGDVTISGPDFEIRTADWLGVDQAVTRVLEGVARVRIPPERLPLSETPGRALAEEIRATATLPPWDNSAMDGYAVRGEDISGATPTHPIVLRVTGLLRAGEVPSAPVGRGEAVRIMTGAPLPPGANSVVRREDTDEEATEGRVSVLRDRDEGRNVRPGGQDMRPGDVVLKPGHAITPGAVGLLAAAGRADAWVHGRPSVAILVTGDELRTPEHYDDVRAGAGVPESNGPMLMAAVTAAGGHASLLGPVPDRMEALAEAVDRSRDADVLITVGGASMGEADLVKRVLEGAGYEPDFWRVRMRPGSPFGFGWLPAGERSQPVFGLPGNPSSAFVTFEVFVRPFLRRLGGHDRIRRRTVVCRAAEEIAGADGLTLFNRVQVDTTTAPPTARLTGPQGSGLVRGLAHAEGLAIIPEGRDAVAPGQTVEVILLDDSGGHPGPRSPGIGASDRSA